MASSSRQSCPTTPRRLPENPRRALEHLRAADPLLGQVIARCGPFRLERHPPGYLALCWAIIGQQLSMLVAGKLTARFTELLHERGGTRPEVALRIEEEALRARGLSGAKARAVHSLAAFWISEGLTEQRLAAMPDEELLELLTSVKGIGPWTVKMFLIFSLRRPDVLPVEDLGLRAGLRGLHGDGDGELPSAGKIEELAEAWRPWRTVGTWYCWRHLEWLREKKNGGA